MSRLGEKDLTFRLLTKGRKRLLIFRDSKALKFRQLTDAIKSHSYYWLLCSVSHCWDCFPAVCVISLQLFLQFLLFWHRSEGKWQATWSFCWMFFVLSKNYTTVSVTKGRKTGREETGSRHGQETKHKLLQTILEGYYTVILFWCNC